MFLSMLMFILISFMYFFMLPPSNLFYKSNNNKIQHQYKSHENFFWNWLW